MLDIAAIDFSWERGELDSRMFKKGFEVWEAIREGGETGITPALKLFPALFGYMNVRAYPPLFPIRISWLVRVGLLRLLLELVMVVTNMIAHVVVRSSPFSVFAQLLVVDTGADRLPGSRRRRRYRPYFV